MSLTKRQTFLRPAVIFTNVTQKTRVANTKYDTKRGSEYIHTYAHITNILHDLACRNIPSYTKSSIYFHSLEEIWFIHPLGKNDLPWKWKRSSVPTTQANFYQTARHHSPSQDAVRCSWLSEADKTVRNARINSQRKTPIWTNDLWKTSNKYVK